MRPVLRRRITINYFSELAAASASLDNVAQKYLDQFEFMPTDEICDRICSRCWEIFKAYGEEFGVVPEIYRDELESVVDGCMPYLAYSLKPGRLKKTLGLSLVSVDAHLRNLWERLEGRTEERLPFPIEATS